MIEFIVKLSSAQKRKFLNGENIILKPEHIIIKPSKSSITLSASENLAKKIHNSHSKSKGIKVNVSDFSSAIQGEGFGSLMKAAKSVASNKAVQGLAKQGLKMATNKAQEKLQSGLSGYIGESGAKMVSNAAGKFAQKQGNQYIDSIGGDGLFQTLNKVGISKKDVKGFAKNAAKKTLVPAATTLASSKLGSFAAPITKNVLNKAIDSGVDKVVGGMMPITFHRRGKKGGELVTAHNLLSMQHPAMHPNPYTSNQIEEVNHLFKVKKLSGKGFRPAGAY